MPSFFDRMGKAHQIRLLKSAGEAPIAMDKFIKDANQANLINQVKGSLHGMASPLHCCTVFCELRKAHPPPDSEEVILQRRSLFNKTATFGNYVTFLEG